MPPFETIDHTADFGIRVTAPDLPGLFKEAGIAMMASMVDLQRIDADQRQTVDVTGADWPDLMVNWLRELLYLVNGDEFLFREIEIQAITEFSLTAEVTGTAFDPGRHRIETEIKAVTYHDIEVTQIADGWSAQVIFDI